VPPLALRAARVLRDEHGGPIDPGYWEALERRIMARIAGAGRPIRLVESAMGANGVIDLWSAWGSAFRAWARAGVLAASIAVLGAGVTLWRTRQLDTRTTYEMVLASPTPVADALPYGAAY
jgi:hypothetical protein